MLEVRRSTKSIEDLINYPLLNMSRIFKTGNFKKQKSDEIPKNIYKFQEMLNSMLISKLPDLRLVGTQPQSCKFNFSR